MRFQVWACRAGDVTTNGTIFNRVVESDDVVEFAKQELARCCNANTVVVKIESLGVANVTTVLVLERSVAKKVNYCGQLYEMTSDLVAEIICDNEQIFLDDGIEWSPTQADTAVVKKLLETGVSLYVGPNRERLTVNDQTEYILSLRF